MTPFKYSLFRISWGEIGERRGESKKVDLEKQAIQKVMWIKRTFFTDDRDLTREKIIARKSKVVNTFR